jgi:hypothetical protein
MIWAGNTAVQATSEALATLGGEDESDRRLPDVDVSFNELLAVGYMQDDRMAVSPRQ